MRAILFFTMILTTYKAFAGDEQEALKKTAEAVSQTETVKTITRNIERAIDQNLPVTKGTAAFIGSTAVTAAQGKVDTKNIKNMDIQMPAGSIRPDAEYDFKDKNSSFKLEYSLGF